MQVSVANTQGLERKMTVVLPAQEIEQEISKRLARLRNTVKLPGFRPGKIPNKVLESNFGSEVLHEVANEMINRSYIQALTDQKIEPATRPRIEPDDINRGEDLTFTATFDVFPMVTRTDLDGMSIERSVCELSDADVDETIDTIRKQHITWTDSEKAAQEGDRVTIDFKGFQDGEPFEGGEAQDYPVVIGDGQLLKGFEDGLLGMQAGEEKSIDVVFPEDYPAEKLAGNKVTFEISAKAVSVSELPEINEEFVKTLGIKDGSVDSMRDQVKENMERELENRIRASLREQVLKALVEINDIEIPAQLVQDEASHIREANLEQMKKQGAKVDSLADQEEQINEEATRRVKLSMVVREVITKHEIKLEKVMMDKKLDEMAGSYEDKSAFRNWYVQDKERLQQLESAVLEQLVVDKLVATASVTEKSVPFKELMDLGQA